MKIKNKYLFFIKRILKDIFNPTIWPLSSDVDSTRLGKYYLVFDECQIENQKGGQKSIIYDENGIAKNVTYIDVKDVDSVYFPITIGQVGLAIYHTWLATGKEKDKQRFLKYADWFEANVTIDDTVGARWLTNVPLPQYHNPGPWQSAFSQSRAISILLRAYQLTGEKKYSNLAEKALLPYTYSVADGGVTSFTNWGPFYEEYTAELPTLVLNGMIFSLFGVYDFIRVFPQNKLSNRIFWDGIETLEKILPEFDYHYWSKYNLCKADWYPQHDLATINYQWLHIVQMEAIYKITKKEIFNDYRKKFKKQMKIVNIFRMYISKYKSLKKLGRL